MFLIGIYFIFLFFRKEWNIMEVVFVGVMGVVKLVVNVVVNFVVFVVIFVFIDVILLYFGSCVGYLEVFFDVSILE